MMVRNRFLFTRKIRYTSAVDGVLSPGPLLETEFNEAEGSRSSHEVSEILIKAIHRLIHFASLMLHGSDEQPRDLLATAVYRDTDLRLIARSQPHATTFRPSSKRQDKHIRRNWPLSRRKLAIEVRFESTVSNSNHQPTRTNGGSQRPVAFANTLPGDVYRALPFASWGCGCRAHNDRRYRFWSFN